MELIELLAEYDRHRASDPRDKVYGFLSLCHQDVQERFGADSDTDLVDCYAWPTIDDIKRSGRLRSLGLALRPTEREIKFWGRALPNEKDYPLPSWVPDWSSGSGRLDSPTERLRLYNLFSAINGSTALFSRQAYILSLWGICIATITDRKNFKNAPCDRFSVLRAWFRIWQRCEEAWRCDRRGEDRSDDKRNDKSPVAFFRTIMLDNIPPFNQPESSPTSSQDPLQATPEDYKHCQRWWALKTAPGRMANDPLETKDAAEAELMDHMEQHVTVSTSHRSFFITESGAIRLGPKSMRVGDEVWVVYGGNMPLVLRATEMESPSRNDTDPQP